MRERMTHVCDGLNAWVLSLPIVQLSVCIVVCHEETAGQRELVHTIKDSLTCQTWFSRPGSCLLCFLLFFYYVFLVYTAFALGLLIFLTSLGLSVFLTFAVTFKKPLFVWRKFLHQAFWSF